MQRAFEADGDDYNAILVKALADRLAESFATVLHERVRREWYQAETLTPAQLIAERHRGIRPAFGYPACPDHTEKGTLFDLLGARELGIELTEHFAMTPTAAVSGIYLGHPASKYFAVGRIGADQVADYAARKGFDVQTAERWLAPNLGYLDVCSRRCGRARLTCGAVLLVPPFRQRGLDEGPTSPPATPRSTRPRDAASSGTFRTCK